MIGETVSHYRVLERLGQGGMGEVFLAEDLRLHRPVALKMLRGEPNEPGDAKTRLLAEARAASALNHPSVAVIYEIDEVDRGQGPESFIAMEYVAGKTLAEVAGQETLDLDAVVEIVHQIAEALVEAHAKGVIHRDIKPGNVMVAEGRRIKILDFGLAKHRPLADETGSTWSRQAPRSIAGTLSGTVAYMSPEQALGRDLDARTDIFSLGVLFYELLAGQRPFAGANAVETIDAILHRDPQPLPSRVDPRIVHVEGILGRMLEKDRERRYPSLRDVCRDLDALRRREAPSSSGASLHGTLAVLAFANITGGGEDEWLGAGIADTLMADLRGAQGLSLVGRERVLEAMRRLGGLEPKIDETLAVGVGRELGTRWVVFGGFQRMGDAIRITAQVLEAETGAVVHALKLDGRMAEIFALQDRLVRDLSQPFRATPLAPEARDAGETQVVAAYEAFSKGVLNLREESHESLDRAVLFLERAVALDPGYRRAHLELGVAYLTRADYLGVPELYERALASFRRALEGKPEFLRAWREIGLCLLSLGREDEGIAAIEKALALAPDEASALMAMGRALFIGKADFRQAATYFERALERRPDAGWYALQLSHCAALLRDFPRGEAAARRAIELQEAALSGREGIRVVGSYMRLGHLLALQERYGEAIDAFQHELAFLQRVDHALRSRIAIELHMRLGSAQKRLGRHEAARASLDVALQAFEKRVGMGADEPFTRYYAACAYALRGDVEKAIACLEKAVKVRPRYTLERARIEPEFEALRGEAGFRELIGLA